MPDYFLTYPSLRILLDGMMYMMVLYAMFNFLQQNKKIYYQYALYIVCLLISFQAGDFNTSQSGKFHPLGHFCEEFFQSIALLLYISFAAELMAFRSNDAVSYKITRWMTGVGWVSLALSLIGFLFDWSESSLAYCTNINRLVLAGGALYVVPRILRLRNVVIAYFIVGSLFFVAGSLIALSANFFSGLFLRIPDQPFTYALIYMQIGVVIENFCFMTGLSTLSHQNELQKLNYQQQLIEQLQETQRHQEKLYSVRDDIARDLHDDMGSYLSSISILSLNVEKISEQDPEKARNHLQRIGETARQVMDSLNDIVWSVNPSNDSMAEVVGKMKDVATELFEMLDCTIVFTVQEEVLVYSLPLEKRRDFLLIYKEILTNAARYSNAKKINVKLQLIENQIVLRVSDDGVGFDVSQPPRTNGGNGLKNIETRANRLGGSVTIDSAPGLGTDVSLVIQLH